MTNRLGILAVRVASFTWMKQPATAAITEQQTIGMRSREMKTLLVGYNQKPTTLRTTEKSVFFYFGRMLNEIKICSNRQK